MFLLISLIAGPFIITQRPFLQTFLKKDANPNQIIIDIISDSYSVSIIFVIMICFRYKKNIFILLFFIIYYVILLEVNHDRFK